MAYDAIRGARALTNRRNAIFKAADNQNTRIAEQIVGIAVHAQNTNDVAELGRLVTGLRTRGVHVSAITTLFAELTSIRVSKDTHNEGAFKAHLMRGDDNKPIHVTAKMVDAVKAAADTWWTFAMEPEAKIVTAVDLEKRVQGVIDFCDRLLKNEAKNKSLDPSAKKEAETIRDGLRGVIANAEGIALG